MAKEQVIREAAFSDNVCKYWLLTGCMTCVLTIVGIPFLLLWIPLGLVFTRRYLGSMECVLTTKALKVKKGILVKVEKTIPLEKITDMGMRQGPIMRAMGLHTLTVETAGQSGPGGALVALTGIVDAEEFRETVLEQRDSGEETANAAPVSQVRDAVAAGSPEDLKQVLVEIRDVLKRIEAQGK
jgi:putative membrane protein